MAAVLLYRPPAPPPGCLDYQVLDVGQGLAVVLRTGEHTVLFDTGPSFRSGSSTADIVVIPFLKSRGIGNLDTLIVSHADQDHAGGVRAIASQFEIGRTLVLQYGVIMDIRWGAVSVPASTAGRRLGRQQCFLCARGGHWKP